MPFSVVLYTGDFAAVSCEIPALGGRITHQFTDAMFVAHLPDSAHVAALARTRPV